MSDRPKLAEGEPVGFAIIGAGLVGPTHAAAAAEAPGGRLVVVCDLVAQRAEALADQYGADWTTDLQIVLERPDVHVVCICLPTRLHLDVAAQAAAAGKHLVIEKPLEISLERADLLLAAARRHGVQVAAIFNRRFAPALVGAKRAIDEGRLGRLIAADMYFKSYRSQAYYDDSGWRGTWDLEGGAALINQGIHGVDLLRWLAGPVSHVFGYADHLRRAIEADDTTVAVVRYANGGLGVIQAMTSIQPRLADRLELHGLEGSIQLEDYRIARWEVPGAEDWPAEVAALEQTAGREATHVGHYAQIADMVDVVRERRTPLVNGVEGRRSLEVVLAIYESAREGREIELPVAAMPT
jgi:UDP-N-acetyl-2-amino-2-deoxyglucuronate dehydrogenase